MLTKVKFRKKGRQALHRGLVDELGLRVVRGLLPSGGRLPTEGEICTEFSVSRTVVRDALRVLSDKGLICSRPRTGTKVQPQEQWHEIDPSVLNWRIAAGPQEDYLQQLVEVRSIIEPAAAGKAATRATVREIYRIAIAFEDMRNTVKDRDAFITADMEFHAAIIAATHNTLIQAMAGTIEAALVASRKVTTKQVQNSADSLPDHEAVLLAIQRHDPEGAFAAMQAVIDRTSRDIARAMSRGRGKR